ncbi:WGR domain-containing protein [Nitratireductor luteus]|uniref:WGR domain-containing protein n=1 Tax=Nitratireductor luteus TaxID=2976980 RepID=UPI0022405A2C|nr:WGR domain-containing protein [Nitratireductor luteus]
MEKTPSEHLLFRIDASRNMARFYCLSIESSLFGDAALVRQWGRIGTRGRALVNLYRSQTEARAAFDRLLAAKQKRGYRLDARSHHAA